MFKDVIGNLFVEVAGIVIISPKHFGNRME
jgi:hypothetical protein